MGEKYDSIINSVFSSQYRFYFDVDNTYVVKKSLMTLAPFVYRGDWTLSMQFKHQKTQIFRPFHQLKMYMLLISTFHL